MAHSRDGVPLWVELMKVVPESFLMGERLRPPKLLVMNSRLPKRTVSSSEKPLHDRRSPLAETMSTDE
jgi:hypothetical protein